MAELKYEVKALEDLEALPPEIRKTVEAEIATLKVDPWRGDALSKGKVRVVRARGCTVYYLPSDDIVHITNLVVFQPY